MHALQWKTIWIPQESPFEVIIRTGIIYLLVQLAFRIVGRREWHRNSVLNVASLMLVPVALRMTIVGTDPSITSGVIALVTMIGLEWLMSRTAYRSPRLANWIKGPVRVLVRDGEVLEDALRKARLSHEELQAHIRLQGHRSVREVGEAYLERSGRISFIFRPPPARAHAQTRARAPARRPRGRRSA